MEVMIAYVFEGCDKNKIFHNNTFKICNSNQIKEIQTNPSNSQIKKKRNVESYTSVFYERNKIK